MPHLHFSWKLPGKTYFLGQPVPLPNHSHSHQTIYQVTCWYYYSITITFTVVLTCRRVQGPLLGTFPLGFFFLHRKTVEFLYFLWGQTIALLSNPSAKKTNKSRQSLLHEAVTLTPNKMFPSQKTKNKEKPAQNKQSGTENCAEVPSSSESWGQVWASKISPQN